MDTVEIINGYTVTSAWKNGQRGMTASATKGGKKYFLKKYTKCVLPTEDGMFDEKTIRFKKNDFDCFVGIRRKVISLLSPIAGPGGNIVIPCENFIYGIHYYEVTEFIDGVIPDKDMESFFCSLSAEERLLMMKTAAGALSAVHSSGVIHSDLKLKNVIVVENDRSNFVAKLIDFDSSYPKDDKKYIGGDDVFCSPELLVYSVAEEEEQPELLKNITDKTDIFSLGVCFHFYLAQEYPTAVELSDRLKRQKELKERAGKTAIFHANQLLLEGCELKLSDKIKSVNLRTLIYDMLSLDPEKRPTAMQVLQRLKEAEPTIEAPWPEHNIILEHAKLSEDGIVGLKKLKNGDKLEYAAIFSSGKKVVYSKNELVSLLYAKEKFVPKGFGDIWPEHSIVFDEDKLRSRNFVAETKETSAGKNGYRLYSKDGDSRFYTIETLLSVGYVKKTDGIKPETTVSATDFDESKIEPWPEHNIEFDIAAIRAKGYVAVSQKIMNGINGYEFVRANGIRQFIRVEMIVMQKMARKI